MGQSHSESAVWTRRPPLRYKKRLRAELILSLKRTTTSVSRTTTSVYINFWSIRISHSGPRRVMTEQRRRNLAVCGLLPNIPHLPLVPSPPVRRRVAGTAARARNRTPSPRPAGRGRAPGGHTPPPAAAPAAPAAPSARSRLAAGGRQGGGDGGAAGSLPAAPSPAAPSPLLHRRNWRGKGGGRARGNASRVCPAAVASAAAAAAGSGLSLNGAGRRSAQWWSSACLGSLALSSS